MALTIDKASQGFDRRGMQSYINEINTKLVDNACNRLNSGMKEIRAAVDQVWVGTSAETFKNNFEHDVDVIRDALQEARKICENALKEAGKAMGDLDHDLVQKR